VFQLGAPSPTWTTLTPSQAHAFAALLAHAARWCPEGAILADDLAEDLRRRWEHLVATILAAAGPGMTRAEAEAKVIKALAVREGPAHLKTLSPLFRALAVLEERPEET
jgi:hypothetical protein